MMEKPIALFDMDGTLCDYDSYLATEMKKLMSPEEKAFEGNIHDAPEYLRNRANILKGSEQWWVNMPKLKLGWDVLGVAQELGYQIMILTQGPKYNPSSWSGKKKWIDMHLGHDTDMTITRNKGLVYGKVLVDDWPEYITAWLAWRKRGLVIMPASPHNAGFTHPQVIRYDGTNLDEVREAMRKLALQKEVEKIN